MEIKKIVVARWKNYEENKRNESLTTMIFHMDNYDIEGFAADCPICHKKNAVKVHNNRAGRYHCKDCECYFYPIVPIIGGDK